MAGWMVDRNDPACNEIIRRALALGISGAPDKAAHSLGKIILADGAEVNAHVVHAVDAVITDGRLVVVINRKNDPGKGLPALPGGFIDPSKGGVENIAEAAVREAAEEAGITLSGGKVAGQRRMNRPFDVRVARKAIPSHNIAEGDVFLVSTQAIRFDVPDLINTNLVAGDDAVPGTARRAEIISLKSSGMGIEDHYELIAEAVPEVFKRPATKVKDVSGASACAGGKFPLCPTSGSGGKRL